MLRKRTRSFQKDQQMGPLTKSDSGSGSESYNTNSFFNVPGLYVGLSPKGMSDCDSVRSPTSPLDFRLSSNLANPSYRSLRLSQYGHQKSWDCSKVGLSIVNSLDGDGDSNMKASGDAMNSSDSKNILFGQKVRNKTPNFQVNANSFEAPKSLPRNFAIFPHAKSSSCQEGSSDVIFEIGEALPEGERFGKVRSCSLDACKSFSNLSHLANRNSNVGRGESLLNTVANNRVTSPLQFSGGSPNSNNSFHIDLNLPPAGSANGFVDSLSASEIELSEDYTCVVSHGPNPKKTHIYGDCVLKDFSNGGKEAAMPQAITSSKIHSSFASNDFLNLCYYCNKKLDGGKDIYIYRGDKAFCSLNCRAQEIMIDEALEKANNKSSSEPLKSDDDKELYESGIFDAP
ncbi:FCS-Like Zinc finger 10-like [Mercurialis annua]|uniref:FCS-Like Zinc finger 10-like n=1 Tax=Mercurialis annua TaxID=3986 RepID=UPI00215DE111|nr:FCS-Like Zinc finger 10-like [Mercurialis annua]XP_050214586.1 FCS-Like Zinc finger 10-like [Mercurialis annua]XP_055959857.1 FCS-Like Zinc finger 10-like [Mercurialis annua]